MVDTLDWLVSSASRQFSARYGGDPEWIVAAPGRVNLIGEHIDYNDGFVLPMAIDRYCVIAAGSIGSDLAQVYSMSIDDEATISLSRPEPHREHGHWSNYVAGVIAGWRELPETRPRGFSAVVASDVPIGGGLSSSASLEVAMATLVETMTGSSLDPMAKALLCQRAEHEFARVPCGIMDQFASVMCRADRLMLLDCRTQQIEHIPLSDPDVTVLIVNSNVKHKLSNGQYAVRREQCEAATRKLGVDSMRDVTMDHLESGRSRLADVEYRRARHVVGEIARTIDAAYAIKRGDWSRVGDLVYRSHDSLRDDYEVSCAELDLLVDVARDIGTAGGVIGARMTGGGFGGCTVSLVQTSKVEDIAEVIADEYQRETGVAASVLSSRPSRGAHVVAANDHSYAS
jgi:galactokinase